MFICLLYVGFCLVVVCACCVLCLTNCGLVYLGIGGLLLCLDFWLRLVVVCVFVFVALDLLWAWVFACLDWFRLLCLGDGFVRVICLGLVSYMFVVQRLWVLLMILPVSLFAVFACDFGWL